LKLPFGVSVEVPKNWWIIDSDTNSTIETAAEAAMNLSGITLTNAKEVTLFRANSKPKTTYAALAIKLRKSALNAAMLKSSSHEEIEELAPEMKQITEEALSTVGLKLIEFYGMRREFVGRHPALVIEYKRSGQQGAVVVQTTRLFIEETEILFDLSYRESEGPMWKPIVRYIRTSVKAA
jgi:hypothetical protein